MNTDRVCEVKNRSNGLVFYKIDELGVRRTFMPGEIKVIPIDELEKLSFQRGGRELAAEYLQITDTTALRVLGLRPEREYYLSDKEIKDLLSFGSQDEFLDCLDFAPTGVIDLLKKYAVELPLSDYRKRKAMLDKLGFDVDKAIAYTREDDAENKKNAPKRRT